MPFIQLMIGDWEQDTNMISLTAEGALIKLTFKLWKAKPKKGEATFSFSQLAFLFKMPEQQMLTIVRELKENNVLNIEIRENERSATFLSRRMEAARLLSEQNSANARKKEIPDEKTKSKRTGSDLMIMTYDYDYNYDISKEKEGTIVYLPFDSENFFKAWQNWKQHRIEKKKPYKTVRSEQAGLNQLKQFDEEFAIGLINRAIDGNWQGLVFAETKIEYQKLKAVDEQKNGLIKFAPDSKRQASQKSIDEELRNRRRG